MDSAAGLPRACAGCQLGWPIWVSIVQFILDSVRFTVPIPRGYRSRAHLFPVSRWAVRASLDDLGSDYVDSLPGGHKYTTPFPPHYAFLSLELALGTSC